MIAARRLDLGDEYPPGMLRRPLRLRLRAGTRSLMTVRASGPMTRARWPLRAVWGLRGWWRHTTAQAAARRRG